MSFLNWFWGFWNWLSNLVRSETLMVLLPVVKNTDSPWHDVATEVLKISALETSTQTLTRDMVQGSIFGHFVKLMNTRIVAGFY